MQEPTAASPGCPACAPVTARARPRARAPWVAVASALLAALVPKCPLCLAAYLSIFGVSVGAASVALRVARPLALAVCALAVGLVLVRVGRKTTARLPCCRPRSG
jgi:hypothetical protein